MITPAPFRQLCARNARLGLAIPRGYAGFASAGQRRRSGQRRIVQMSRQVFCWLPAGQRVRAGRVLWPRKAAQ